MIDVVVVVIVVVAVVVVAAVVAAAVVAAAVIGVIGLLNVGIILLILWLSMSACHYGRMTMGCQPRCQDSIVR